MAKKWSWFLIVALAIIVGIYPLIYFFIDRKFGLLGTKSNELLTNTFWNIGFYTHILSAGVSLLLGWTQFSIKRRLQNVALHRNRGKIYVASSLLSSITGVYIGFFATGGLVSSLGFICLGAVWFYTTLMAYINIRNNKIDEHRKMMIFSYAACLAGVTLRIWLPILTFLIGDSAMAYKVDAWMCWIPNIIVAYIITRHRPVIYRN